MRALKDFSCVAHGDDYITEWPYYECASSRGRTPYLVAADWGNDAITELLDEAERRNADQAKEMLKSSRPGSNELGKFEAVVNVKSASSETACKRRSDAVFEEVHIRLGRVYRVGELLLRVPPLGCGFQQGKGAGEVPVREAECSAMVSAV